MVKAWLIHSAKCKLRIHAPLWETEVLNLNSSLYVFMKMTFRLSMCCLVNWPIECDAKQFVRICITKTRLFKYIENSPLKTENFQMKNSDIFHISAKNHRLWLLVRTALARRFYRVPTMFLSTNKKNNVYLCKPQFYYIKVGFKRVKII